MTIKSQDFDQVYHIDGQASDLKCLVDNEMRQSAQTINKKKQNKLMTFG